MVPANGAASINYRLRSEVSITLHHQLDSAGNIQLYKLRAFLCYQSICEKYGQ